MKYSKDFAPQCRAIMLVLVGSFVTQLGCGDGGSSNTNELSVPPTPVPVSAFVVDYQETAVTEDVIGTIRARVHAAVEAKISGKVEALRVRLGQQVLQGELLLQLDTRELKSRQQQAAAVRDQAARESRRRAELVARGAVSVQQAEEAASKLQIAQAALAEAQAMLGYAEVRAPFDGVISKTLVDVGDLALPGKVLVEIDSYDAFHLECGVPELLVSHLSVGDAVKVLVPAADTELSGVVEEMSPSGDAETRTSLVKIRLPEFPGLRVGQFARAQIPNGVAKTLMIPKNARIVRGQLEYVYVIADGHAQLRLIRSGKASDSSLEVLAGLAPSEQIVRDVTAQLKDNVPAQVVP